MAKDLGVQGFFNGLAVAMRDSVGTTYDSVARDTIRKLVTHMSPANRSGARHSIWPTAAQMLLNNLYPDGRHFAPGISPLNHIIAHNGSLMGLEYMGAEVNSQGGARPKFRFMMLSVPGTGELRRDNDGIKTYYLKDIPASAKMQGELVDRLDEIVKIAVATGGPEHIRVVAESLKPGYQDLSVPGRLRNLLTSAAP